jgi:hypothetical protein
VRGFTYYRGPDGYLCGGGAHFICHAEVDGFLAGQRPMGPYIEHVNVTCNVPGVFMGPQIIMEPGIRAVAPPKDGWHEPMHWCPQDRLANFMNVIPLKFDGTPWRLDETRYPRSDMGPRAMMGMMDRRGGMGL